MSAGTVVDVMRAGWLTLAFMMLLSRAAFQLAGPVWMRSFLDGWKRGGVKRVWGATSLAFAGFLVAAAAARGDGLGAMDWVLLAALVLVLAVDGLLNVLPAGFETFKDRVQEVWVARRRGTRTEGDAYLFGTVNALLALAAAAAAVVVIVYRPIAVAVVLVAAALALVLTTALIAASSARRVR
jgi:hypothetical protein